MQVGARLTQPFPSIQIDENWTGTPEELRLIEQITTAPGPDNIDQWMIVFAGPQVTDAWIDVIAKDKNVAVLELKNTHVTDRGIERLAESPSLQFLEIKYTPISDRSLPAIASIRRLARLKLYGTRVTPAGIEKFRQQFGGVAVDYRRGGFLGIGCDDNPCRVTTVREGTAAAKAGLQFGDVITKYNGKPVRTMDELTALIAENQVGDAVTIEIDRGGETIVREVVLGAWE